MKIIRKYMAKLKNKIIIFKILSIMLRNQEFVKSKNDLLLLWYSFPSFYRKNNNSCEIFGFKKVIVI